MRPSAIVGMCLVWGAAGCHGGGGGGADRCADVVCAASDGCHAAGTCDPATGQCSTPALEDRTLCALDAGGQGWCQAGACQPLASCQTGDDCLDDTRCAGELCWPWSSQTPRYDEVCTRPIPAGAFSPALRCEFASAPAGDPFPDQTEVESTPLVASFTGLTEAPLTSVVATFAAPVPTSYTELGVVRILRGDDCTQQAVLGGTDLDGDGSVDWIVASATPAVGDLDGDGEPDLVAAGADGSTLAFTHKLGWWSLLWKAPWPAGAPWAPCSGGTCLDFGGPSLHDLDDDGEVEVLREGVVFRGENGHLLSLQPAGWARPSVGSAAVAADVDGDGRAELANGQYLWHAGGPPFAWVAEAGYSTGSAAGQVAIADLGAYGAGEAAGAPEIVSFTAGAIRAQALDGSIVFGPIRVPGNALSSPLAVADVDGDGLPEIVGHGTTMLAAFDPDCGPSPRAGGTCAPGTCDHTADRTCPAAGGIAWSRSILDTSSGTAGIAAFDLDGDRRAEILFADECFARVYGAGGAVLASTYHTSCTWMEYPVAADVDGDHRAELMIPSNEACRAEGYCNMALDGEGVDAAFPGQRCASAADCTSGACADGYCRCTSTAQCCAAGTDAACLEAGAKCAAPPAGTPGAGNTCRAAHPHRLAGLRVYADAHDHWIGARRIWNQHACTPTAASEAGVIPRTSAWSPSWSAAAGDGFRLGVPGTPDGRGAGDATVSPGSFACTAAGAVLSAPICNRGSEAMAAGLPVEFRSGGGLVCATATAGRIEQGACETVSCTWSSPPSEAAEVTATVNGAGARSECWSRNGVGHVARVACP